VLIARGDAPNGGYRRVVLGCDFSTQARVALRQAIDAAAPGARLDIVHCWNMSFAIHPYDGMPPLPPEYYQETVDALRAEGEAWVAIARERGDLDVRLEVLERPAIHGICDYARDAAADLIVVGSHGRRGVRRFILGSVAEATARHAPCSTLIARS
jgi:nucleotide-binding universal stress UspA family protein